jgi:hypothetical protein
MPLQAAAYLEAMKGAKRSVAIQKQRMAAVREGANDSTCAALEDHAIACGGW